jgi:fibronectin-binding autotransporter adhesin
MKPITSKFPYRNRGGRRVAGLIWMVALLHASVLRAATNTVTVCDLAHLQTAVAGGGTINFGCDATIVLTNTLTISKNTILDGSGHAVTISGNNAVRPFLVNTSISFTLVNLTVANGLNKGTNSATAGVPGGSAFGGGLYNDGGMVTALGVSFTGNSVIGGTNGANGNPVSIGSGGAIYNNVGSLNITNCTFSNNLALGANGGSYGETYAFAGHGYGGAISSKGGVVNVDNSGIVTNSSIGGLTGSSYAGGNGLGGGLYAAAGTVAIRNCNFMTNAATGPNNQISSGTAGRAKGGGIYEEAGVVLRITGSTFNGNSARGGDAGYHDTSSSGYGGALFINGTLNSTNCIFAGNYTIGGSHGLPKAADAMGGAIYNLGTANIINATISSNHTLGGTATAQSNGPLTPGFAMGGGIYNSNVVLLLNSTLSGNFATGGTGTPNIGGGFGGTALGGAIYNVGTFTGTNNTLFGNLAIGGDGGLENTNRWGPSGVGFGGGLYNDTNGIVILTHQTFSDNSIEHGSSLSPITLGFGGGIFSTNGTVTLRNSIVANSPLGTNCWGSVIDGGGNIISDASVNFTAPGSHTNTNPVLGPLGNYGGPTQTMPLLAGSPALNAGTAAFCPAKDQRGIARPFGSGCDIGAFESAPPYIISGQVRGYGIAGGIQVAIGTNSLTTDSNGNYSANGFGAGGLYNVTPSAAGLVFVPGSRLISLGPDAMGVNFDAYGSIT